MKATTRQRRTWLVCLALVVTAVAIWRSSRSGWPGRALTLRGQTMGTTYKVTVHGRIPLAADGLRQRIETRLREINESMSTWDENSEISRINAMPPGKVIPLSREFREVLAAALRLSEETGGAFDVTVGPLVNLWGYGPVIRDQFPSPREIEAAMARSGYENLSLSGQGLTKRLAGMSLDFSGIAKGYGVDEVAAILRREGIANYLVEIGGEIAAHGTSPTGEPWSVGIERPDEGAARGAALSSVVHLTEGALATSGSYRRFRRHEGRKSHHVIDPRTGKPTVSSLVSVTVHAADCMTADAVTTALMVMGTKKGLQWVEGRPGVEALFLEALEDEGYAQHLSSGFEELMTAR